LQLVIGLLLLALIVLGHLTPAWSAYLSPILASQPGELIAVIETDQRLVVIDYVIPKSVASQSTVTAGSLRASIFNRKNNRWSFFSEGIVLHRLTDTVSLEVLLETKEGKLEFTLPSNLLKPSDQGANDQPSGRLKPLIKFKGRTLSEKIITAWSASAEVTPPQRIVQVLSGLYMDQKLKVNIAKSKQLPLIEVRGAVGKTKLGVSQSGQRLPEKTNATEASEATTVKNLNIGMPTLAYSIPVAGADDRPMATELGRPDFAAKANDQLKDQLKDSAPLLSPTKKMSVKLPLDDMVDSALWASIRDHLEGPFKKRIKEEVSLLEAATIGVERGSVSSDGNARHSYSPEVSDIFLDFALTKLNTEFKNDHLKSVRKRAAKFIEMSMRNWSRQAHRVQPEDYPTADSFYERHQKSLADAVEQLKSTSIKSDYYGRLSDLVNIEIKSYVKRVSPQIKKMTVTAEKAPLTPTEKSRVLPGFSADTLITGVDKFNGVEVGGSKSGPALTPIELVVRPTPLDEVAAQSPMALSMLKMKNGAMEFGKQTILFNVPLYWVTLAHVGMSYAKNPLAITQFFESLEDPAAHVGFAAFIATNHKFSRWWAEMANPKLHFMGPYLGMAMGMTASHLISSFWHDPMIQACAKSMLKDKGSCQLAYNSWVLSGKINELAPAITGLIGTALASGLVSKGISQAGSVAKENLKQLANDTKKIAAAVDKAVAKAEIAVYRKWQVELGTLHILPEAKFNPEQVTKYIANLASNGLFASTVVFIKGVAGVMYGNFVFLTIDPLISPQITQKWTEMSKTSFSLTQWLQTSARWSVFENFGRVALFDQIKLPHEIDVQLTTQTFDAMNKSVDAFLDAQSIKPKLTKVTAGNDIPNEVPNEVPSGLNRVEAMRLMDYQPEKEGEDTIFAGAFMEDDPKACLPTEDAPSIDVSAKSGASWTQLMGLHLTNNCFVYMADLKMRTVTPIDEFEIRLDYGRKKSEYKYFMKRSDRNLSDPQVSVQRGTDRLFIRVCMDRLGAKKYQSSLSLHLPNKDSMPWYNPKRYKIANNEVRDMVSECLQRSNPQFWLNKYAQSQKDWRLTLMSEVVNASNQWTATIGNFWDVHKATSPIYTDVVNTIYVYRKEAHKIEEEYSERIKAMGEVDDGEALDLADQMSQKLADLRQQLITKNLDRAKLREKAITLSHVPRSTNRSLEEAETAEGLYPSTLGDFRITELSDYIVASMACGVDAEAEPEMLQKFNSLYFIPYGWLNKFFPNVFTAHQFSKPESQVLVTSPGMRFKFRPPRLTKGTEACDDAHWVDTDSRHRNWIKVESRASHSPVANLTEKIVKTFENIFGSGKPLFEVPDTKETRAWTREENENLQLCQLKQQLDEVETKIRANEKGKVKSEQSKNTSKKTSKVTSKTNNSAKARNGKIKGKAKPAGASPQTQAEIDLAKLKTLNCPALVGEKASGEPQRAKNSSGIHVDHSAPIYKQKIKIGDQVYTGLLDYLLVNAREDIINSKHPVFSNFMFWYKDNVAEKMGDDHHGLWQQIAANFKDLVEKEFYPILMDPTLHESWLETGRRLWRETTESIEEILSRSLLLEPGYFDDPSFVPEHTIFDGASQDVYLQANGVINSIVIEQYTYLRNLNKIYLKVSGGVENADLERLKQRFIYQVLLMRANIKDFDFKTLKARFEEFNKGYMEQLTVEVRKPIEALAESRDPQKETKIELIIVRGARLNELASSIFALMLTSLTEPESYQSYTQVLDLDKAQAGGHRSADKVVNPMDPRQ
jgi:hypothetical protein